jgi:hypothetical protein
MEPICQNTQNTVRFPSQLPVYTDFTASILTLTVLQSVESDPTMAGDFTMAGFAMIRAHHTGGLGDISVNSYRVKSRQTQPLAGGLALCDKLSPFCVLAPPHRTNLLALKGYYYIDENQVFWKNSNFAPMATVQETPSSPPINSVDGIASTRNFATIAREEISMFEVGSMVSTIPNSFASARDTSTVSQEQISATGLINMASSTADCFASVSRIPSA